MCIRDSENGEYNFLNVPPGLEVSIKLDNPADYAAGGPLEGLVLTLQDAGTNDLLDSDAMDMDGFAAIMDTTPDFVEAASTEDNSFDFGFVEPVQIGNFVWIDANGDGLQDTTDVAIEGVTVSLFNKTTGAFITDTFTDENGQYLFDIAPNLDFTIKLDNPADYLPGGPLNGLSLTSQDVGGSDDLDSDGMDMGGVAAIMGISPATGQDLTFDFGFVEALNFPGVATGPTHFFWNTNLGIMNIASMFNGGGSFFDSVITTFSNDGAFNNQTGTWIFPDGNSDVVLGGLPANSFGIGQMDLVPTDSADAYDGLIAQYRFAPDGNCLLYTSPSPRDATLSRMPSSA